MDLETVIRGKRGLLTYAYIDGPDDKWFWAIVTDYEGCQDYGEVIMAFEEEYAPSRNTVKTILAALEETPLSIQD